MSNYKSMEKPKGNDHKAAKVAAKKKAMSKVQKSPVKGGGKFGNC